MAIEIAVVYTLAAMALAIGVNVISSVGRRFLTDIERLRRISAELKEYRREVREAMRKRDKKDEEKLRRAQKQMNQLQAEMSRANLKPTLLFMLPFLGLWYLLTIFIPVGTVVAISPISLNLIPGLLELTGKAVDLQGQLLGYEMSFFWWYLIVSFAFSSLVGKASGVSLD